MHKLILSLCFLLITASYGVDPSPDFNITNFAGDWNVTGIFSTKDLNINFYSCSNLNVNLGALNILTLTLGYIEVKNNKYVQSVRTLAPSPLNKAILISTISPSQENNFVVTYYNQKMGEAIIINPAVTFGYILSKNKNPAYNDLRARAIEILKNLKASLDNITFIFNNNCDAQKLQPIQNFDIKIWSNKKYYGNAIYTTLSSFKAPKCFTTKITVSGSLLNVAGNFTSSLGKSIYTISQFLSSPLESGVFINTQIRNLAAFVLLYANTSNEIFVLGNGDRTQAFIFSKSQTLPFTELILIKTALTKNGMIPSDNTFYELNPSTFVCSIPNSIDMITF